MQTKCFNAHPMKWQTNIMGLDVRNMSSGFTNNKGADQPAHPHSVFSTFVIHLLESKCIISDLLIMLQAKFNFIGSL